MVETLLATARRFPQASASLLARLRATGKLPRLVALRQESETFSTLQGGAEFRRWLINRGPMPDPPRKLDNLVTYSRSGDVVTLTLDDPESLNAYSAAMRDELADQLDACLVDPTAPQVVVRGAGRAFCTGGLLREFGQATDLAEAHEIRMAQSAASRLWQLGSRASIRIQGAAIGSGIEIAACAERVSASPRSWFRLPELAMGLIPGAGGTISVPGRIGRHRAAWMIFSGARIGAEQALAWGLVDEIEH